jgi:hypothetical protein
MTKPSFGESFPDKAQFFALVIIPTFHMNIASKENKVECSSVSHPVQCEIWANLSRAIDDGRRKRKPSESSRVASHHIGAVHSLCRGVQK